MSRFESPPSVALRPVDVEASLTLGFRAEPEGFRAVFRKSWIVVADSDCNKATTEFVAYVMPKARLFWERFSDLREVLKMLSRNDEESRSYGGPDHLRAEKAVALTILLDGEDVGRKLAQEKEAILKGEQLLSFKAWAERAL